MTFRPYFGDYEIAGLIRLGGAGLGNLLFPLSRAYIYSIQNNATLLPPIWPSLKIGPIIRGEKEKRLYLNLFKPMPFTRWRLSITTLFNRKISEDYYLTNKNYYPSNSKVCVIVKGLKNYFKDLKGYNDELLQYILQIASSKIKNYYISFNQDNIGVHIRLGDYNESARVPIEWYINVIMTLQRHPHFTNTNFIVFSDGTDSELEKILQLKNCSRIETPNSLADILRLAKCKVIIGSNSTFSAWATFLGKKPFIRHEKFYMGNIHPAEENIYEGHDAEDFLSKINP